MRFTTECFIRNVNEVSKLSLISKLTTLGYKPMYMVMRNNLGGNNLVLEGQTWHCTDSDNKPHCIDCKTNEQLFLAIASLRDDTDKHQWFTDGNILEMCESELPSRYMQINGHKATVEELIKLFSHE